MAEKMIAFCGIVCSECEAYLATQANDMEALERLAARARAEYGMAEATAEASRCMGCLATSGPQCSYCSTCEIRACAQERQLANCAHCDDYVCDKLEAFFKMAPASRAILDGIRAGLTG